MVDNSSILPIQFIFEKYSLPIMHLTKLKWCIKINSKDYCNRILDKKKFI